MSPMKTPASLRFFRALLLLYPRDFRNAFGARMEEAFQASLDKWTPGLGPLGVPLCWLRVSWDTVTHAVDLRLRSAGSLPHRSRGPRAPGLGGRPTRGPLFSNSAQDLRYTFRTLRRSPTFTVVVALTAALGISLATLVFSIVNASFLRPLPHVRNPDELVTVSRRLASSPDRFYRLSYHDYLRLREGSTTLDDLVGVIPNQPLMLRTEAELDRQVMGGEVTGNYFLALGIPMALGRGILPDDERSGSDVAVLGHATWVRDFGGSSQALGQVVRIDGRQYSVVGVAPPGLGWLSGEPVESAAWIPLRSRFRDAEDANVLVVAGRRRGRMTVLQAQAECDALASGLATSDPDRWTEPSGESVGLRVMTDREARLEILGGPRGLASVLFYLVFVGLIMAITCSNVATLMLNRALRRRSEIAMRLALGAGRGRLVRQLLTESLLLFSLAGLLAFLLVHLGTRLLAAGRGVSLPVVADVTVDLRVAAFAVAVTLVSGLAFGLVPALQATRPDLAPALKGAGERRSSRGFGPRNLLVLAQVSASMVLVAVSALLVRGVQEAGSVDLGFEPRGVAVASLDLRHGEYGAEEGGRWLETLTERLKGLPGVEAVALSSWVPLSGSRWTSGVRPEGYDLAPDQAAFPLYNSVSPGYFEVVGMPFLAGRDFEASDGAEAPGVIIINEAFARRFWPGQDPLGRSVSLGGDGTGQTVVGVVRDAMYGIDDMRSGQAEPHFWAPRGQRYSDLVQIQVRTRGAMDPVLAALREEIRLLDQDLPILQLAPMEKVTANALVEQRAAAVLFGGFSLLALLLAALGIYGVMAHAVMERTREMGVRLALGANPGRVVGMVLADSLRISVVGMGIGLALAILVGMGIRVLLVGVSAADPVSLSGSAAVLTLAALLAGLLPALRAASLDPVLSLKSE